MMERLTFGAAGVRRAEVPEARVAPRAVAEAEVRPVVTDPLPGESSDWAYGGLLAFTALLFFRPQEQIPALASLHLAEVAAVVGLTAMAAKRLARGLPATRVTPELIALVLFGSVLAATSAFSFWPGGSLEVLTGMYVKVLLIVVLMANSITSVPRLERFVWLVVVASGYIASRAVFDYVRGVNLVENGRVAGSVSGIFGNPNDLALNMVAFLPFAVFYAVRPRVPKAERQTTAPQPRTPGIRLTRASRPASDTAAKGPLWAWLAAGCAALMLLAVVFTKSRSGFLGMVVMLVPVVWSGSRLRPGLGALLVVSLVASVPFLPSSFWQRMDSILNPAEDPTGSREARRLVMGEAFEVFLERPLTGIGPGQFKNYNPPGKKEQWREAHDVWLQVASESGIGGLLAFLFLVVSAFEAAASTRRRLRREMAAARSGAAHRSQSVFGPRGKAGPTVAVARSPAAWREIATLDFHAAALVAALWGWLVCAIFASVAYNWTFYYLLGLGIAARDLAAARVSATPQER